VILAERHYLASRLADAGRPEAKDVEVIEWDTTNYLRRRAVDAPDDDDLGPDPFGLRGQRGEDRGNGLEALADGDDHG